MDQPECQSSIHLRSLRFCQGRRESGPALAPQVDTDGRHDEKLGEPMERVGKEKKCMDGEEENQAV